MEKKVFKKIDYQLLNARQKENYNYHKASALLAEYGFTTLRLMDDWQGADFIAYNIDGTSLFVQLKGRLTFEKKYIGKNIWICFPYRDRFFLYPHDDLLNTILEKTTIGTTVSWVTGGGYSFPHISSEMMEILTPYLL